jgi:mRNA interferase HigB
MRIIAIPFLNEIAKRYPKARKWIETWRAVTQAARWSSLQDLRRVYPSADAVSVKSGGTVTIFNACGNDFRLIAAIHYNRKVVYTLRFLTHAEYSKEKWKNEL